MVLIWLQFIACMAHSSLQLKRSEKADFTMVMTAENIQQDKNVEISVKMVEALQQRLEKHHINGVILTAIPKGYIGIQNPEKRARLIPNPNRLTIDFKTEYYSQIAGRFRWVVHATILLQEDELTSIQKVSIPVFHKFGHQKDMASIENAMPEILDRISLMVNEHIKGSTK